MSDTTTDIQNPTDWSDYDFLEFECFVSKVGHEGFLYAAENYGPEFEDPQLNAVAEDLSALRAFYREHLPKVEAWYETVGMERACDIHNDHVDEAWQRRDDACLFGIRCDDGYIITCDTQDYRDSLWAQMQEEAGKSHRRIPSALLAREVPGGEWTEVRTV